MEVSARRILIVLLGAIGDVVRAMPLAMRLRKAYPQAYIAWAVEPVSANLLAHHPAIDSVLLFDRQGGLTAFWRFLRLVKDKRFDLSLDLQRHAKSGLVSWASHAPVRMGFHRSNSRELNWIFNTQSVSPMPHLSSKLEQYLSFADCLKLPSGPVEFGLHLKADERERVRELLVAVKGTFAALFIGSTWPSRLWPVASWAALIMGLAELGVGVVLLGGQGESAVAAQILKLVGGRAVSLVGKTSLREAFGVLSAARVAVGPDSGPMHLAAAAGTRVVSLWGATSPARSAPWDSEQLVVVGRVPCAPCYLRSCPIGGLCMEAITAERVLRVARRALEEEPH